MSATKRLAAMTIEFPNVGKPLKMDYYAVQHAGTDGKILTASAKEHVQKPLSTPVV